MSSGRYNKSVGFRYKDLSVSQQNYYSQLWFWYHNKMFGALIFRGRKLHAYKMMLDIKSCIKTKEGVDPSLVFLVSMLRITPEIMLRFIKMGGSRQGIPAPISNKKRITYAIKWVVKLLRDKDKNRRVTSSSIADLLCAALRNKGDAIKKKEEYYKTASLNRHLVARYLR